MTDAHVHVSCRDATVRELLVGRDFFGTHPWDADGAFDLAALRARLDASPRAGVGEIGLDRLRDRAISPQMRMVFEEQLKLAAELGRPVVLHGAKCWGQVVEAVRGLGLPAVLFHGFSRSDGLLPDIVALNGYVSVGPAILNEHAVNYRALVKKIPRDRLVVETDRDASDEASMRLSVRDVLAKLAEVIGVPADELERITDANAERFLAGRAG